MKATLIRSSKGSDVVKKYVKACKKPLPKIEVTLKPVDKLKGFYINEKFVDKVIKRTEVVGLDQEICAHVVAVFLETFENKKKRVTK